MSYFGWNPDDLPANRARYGFPLPNDKRNGGECRSAIHFDIPTLREWFVEDHFWQVQSWEPLTVSPSLLCTACGDHGFIREGRWVPA
jgi:hypothetical protein